MDGTDVGGTGHPDVTEEGFVPSNLPFIGTVQAQSDTIEIMIQVASYRYLNGGLVQTPEFGRTSDVLASRDHARLADMIVITTMLVFAVYFAGMFRQWRRDPYLIFFSLFCLASGLFFSIDNEIVLATLLPSFPFLTLQKLLFILPYFIIFFFIIYVNLYLGVGDTIAFKCLRGISYPYMVLIIFIPNEYLMYTLWTGIALQIAVFALIFFWLFRCLHRGVHVYYILLGVFFMVISCIYAQTRYLLALDNPYYMIVTPLLLVLSQSFLMSERNRETFERSERLAEQLLINDRQKDEFLVRTSHEFKTPLHGIINLAQVVIDQGGGNLAQRHRDNLHYIMAQATGLSVLVNDIIDFQSLQNRSLKFQNRLFEVSGTVQAIMEALKYLRRNDEVQLVNRVKAGAFYLYTDENRFKQILVNLIGNALKYTEKGKIVVDAESLEGMLHLTVSDTGAGISRERQDRLFSDDWPGDDAEFSASAFPSSGLGLNISRALAAQMGGELMLQWSEPEIGSVFALQLPEATTEHKEREIRQAGSSAADPKSGPPPGLPALRDKQMHAAGASRAAEASRAQGTSTLPRAPHHVTILLVDDNPSNIKVLEELLAPGQYRILAAYNGKDALDLIDRHQHEISLVLLDVMMPDLSGYEVCRRIREKHPLYKLPVLLLTVRHSPADVALGLEAGANDFLPKPFDGKELMARVHTLLELKYAVEQAFRMETIFLQSQIRPHFIYNALTSIAALCYIDGERAGELLAEFSNFMRLSFEVDPRNAKISLRRELDLVKSYLELEQARFGERLRVEWDMRASQETLIPALVIQPLVENAIRHGLMKKLEGGTVKIQASTDQHGLRVIVEDDGGGMSAEQLETILSPDRYDGRIGLINIHRRLMNEYGQGLQIESAAGKGTRISLHIPASA
jgi:signal transduction histidine kinase